jgi:hypothetical protein
MSRCSSIDYLIGAIIVSILIGQQLTSYYCLRRYNRLKYYVYSILYYCFGGLVVLGSDPLGLAI